MTKSVVECVNMEILLFLLIIMILSIITLHHQLEFGNDHTTADRLSHSYFQ